MPAKNVRPSGAASSETISDLEGAIRSLELSTTSSKRSRCDCNATRHPLLTSAPNCLRCGKIICVKEGLGPCTFCGAPLLSSDETQSMIRTLKDERGREKMEANKRTQRRAEVSQTPRAFTDHGAAQSTALTAAEQHRNRLLSYQATSAQRTRVIDETADFETPSSGQSIWASPQERALQLKKQQKVLREQEWNAKPAYEKRGTVLSIDLAGGKVMKKMGRIERPASDEENIAPLDYPTVEDTQIGQGSFSRNPLLGTLIRPVYRPQEETARNEVPTQRQKTWRRVQDDNNDNEAVILDGGIYGQQTESSSAGPA